ncbi:MAG: hypothetical protein LBU60_04100 [Clostridiales bacterium]|jgi:hypothetical protein|nr:hypothetical protein [Clostridiales bacterium]
MVTSSTEKTNGCLDLVLLLRFHDIDTKLCKEAILSTLEQKIIQARNSKQMIKLARL